jgi:hypothetical protein
MMVRAVQCRKYRERVDGHAPPIYRLITCIYMSFDVPIYPDQRYTRQKGGNRS